MTIEKLKKQLAEKSDRLKHVGLLLQGDRSIILCWTPEGQPRKRKSFAVTKLDEAFAEADRIEGLMRSGYEGIVEVPRGDLAALVRFREQFGNVSLADILDGYLASRNGVVMTRGEILIGPLAEEFRVTRECDDYSKRHQSTLKSHLKYFSERFGNVSINTSPDTLKTDLEKYLRERGAPKTRLQHLITIRTFFTWLRDSKHLLPFRSTPADQVKRPVVVNGEHTIYSPEQFARLLIFTPTDGVMFMVLGQLAGFRSSERLRLLWEHWREEEDNKIVANRDVTKTKKRRRVDVVPSLGKWLSVFRREPDDFMVERRKMMQITGHISKKAGFSWCRNALRAGYASYHLELFQDAALTAKNDGHSVNELETDYMSISGVTKKTAKEIFDITPQAVLAYAKAHKLPTPEWAGKVKNHR